MLNWLLNLLGEAIADLQYVCLYIGFGESVVHLKLVHINTYVSSRKCESCVYYQEIYGVI